jgi:ABC-2 type transport system permease protein
MRGGAVVAVAGNYMISPQQLGGGITMDLVQDGLQEMLASYGVNVEEAMVLDTRNQPFPVQVQRNVGGLSVVEIQQVDYPYFVDVRQDGMESDSPIVANLPAVTLNWVSPLEIDPEKTQGLKAETLLTSTDESWLRTATDVQPNLGFYPGVGFAVEGEQKSRPLAVSLQGSFESYFKDHPSPFQESGTEGEAEVEAAAEAPSEEETAPVLGTIEQSPESSRLVVIGSAEFIDDVVLDLSSSLSADMYLLNLQFMQNVVDWSVEDQDLLAIRSRGAYTRLLEPLEEGEQSFWEWLNYGVALLAVIAIGAVWNLRRRSEAPMPLVESTSLPQTNLSESGGEA